MTKSVDNRAYNWVHRRKRAQLLRTVNGKPCPLCGEPMIHPGQDLHLDHTDPTSKQLGRPGDQLVHAHCNRLKGQGMINFPAGHFIEPTNITPTTDEPKREWREDGFYVDDVWHTTDW